MAEYDPCVDLKPLDDLLAWWVKNEGNICRKPGMVEKYHRLTGRIEDYRRKACDLMMIEHHMEQIIISIDKLRQINHKLTQDLEPDSTAFCKRWADSARELDRLKNGAGFPTQALVTKWFHEARFRITGIEVEHEDAGKHDFDIEIEAEDGSTYDIEVWQGIGPLAHEEQLTKSRALSVNGKILCVDGGAWNESMKYISKYGGIGDDADANFRTLMKKMAQMRKDRIGVVVACIRRDLKPDITLIPKEWGPRLPDNRCVIALRIGDGGWTEERRGTGYLVCSPKFGHADAAKTMIESLRFEYVDYPTPWKYKWEEQYEI